MSGPSQEKVREFLRQARESDGGKSEEDAKIEGCKDILLRSIQCDFLSLEIPQREWIIPQFLYQAQNTMIYSRPGVGKTNFSLAIASACSRGGKLFGPYSVPEPTGVLYLDGEMGGSEMQERLESMWIRPDPDRFRLVSSEVISSMNVSVPNITDHIWRRSIFEILQENPLKVLFLDNLSSLSPGTDELSGEDWDPINQWLLKLRRIGVSTILVHHANKTNSQRGTSKREDQMDLILKLTEIEGRKVSTFRVDFQKARSLRTDDREPFIIERHQRGDQWMLVHSILGEDRLAQVSFLCAEGWKQRDIAVEVGITQGTVSKILEKARNRGLLDGNSKLTQWGEACCATMKSI